jgi:hypothetical protein
MYVNEHLLRRLAQDRNLELAREASRVRMLAKMRYSWRSRLARSLVGLARRLEPNEVGTGRIITRV